MKTETRPTHTPTPWKSDGSYIIGGDNLSVAKATVYKGTNEAKDIENETKAKTNAAFIVRAVNHIDLAIKYLKIEHRKEKEGPHHNSDCDLCEFIAKAEGRS